MKKILLVSVLIISTFSFAQTENPYPATSIQKRIDAFNQRMEMRKNSLVKNVELKSIGPTIMSGRVDDLTADPSDPTHFYVAYATGGLWKTTDNGISFTPLFDEEASMTIGAIAVDWKHGETIWVGTGESNSSRSSYAGTGVYKSTDNGKTWEWMGLGETQHIGRIVIDPNDPNTVWVAAVGHLYSANPERGVFKTTDGGKSWKKTLFVDDTTGAIDLAIDPSDPKIIYAATWKRIRHAWNFVGAGKTSGIYKSKDSGDTWNLISGAGSGFPNGDGIGRIGLAVFPKNPQIVYAVLDNQFHREKEKGKEQPTVTREKLINMPKEEFLKLKNDDLNKFLDDSGFPEKYTAKSIKEMVESGKISVKDVAVYLEDAEEQLYSTPIIGTEVYRSDNGGKTWKKANEKYIDDLFYTYGYYFGQVRINPVNDKEIYLLGVPAIRSEDGGKTFSLIDGDNVHGDFHALWIDPNKPEHLIIGNDGGLNITYDKGKHWFKANTPAVGQFYSIAFDMDQPFNVYGGLQDNGVWYGPSNYTPNYEWYALGQYPFKSIMGGDGMQVAVDTTNNTTVYTGFQFGYYYRVNTKTEQDESVKPVNNIGTPNLRFNWESPIKLSSHNHDVFYIGSNILYRSLNQGKNLIPISGDLTDGGRSGNVPYGTLTTIDESPLKFGLLYTGSDDGLVYVSKDGGVNWEKISGNFPQNLWVSRVTASSFDTGTVYVSLNGYRWDDFNSYLYRSTNYGNSWEKIGSDLPEEPINVVKEDPVNKNILYVGTDHGLYLSLDVGKTFMPFFKNMPQVPVHDVAIQPRDKKIVVGTHGRSIYIGNVKYIEQLTDTLLAKKVYLFSLNNLSFNPSWGKKGYAWSEPRQPEMNVAFYSSTNNIAKINILTEDGKLIKQITDTCDHGLNFYDYDLSVDSNKIDLYKKFVEEKLKRQNEKTFINSELTFEKTDNGKSYLRPGKYNLEIEINGAKDSRTFEVMPPKKSPREKKELTP